MATGQKIVVVGTGINGVTAAIALSQRGHHVTLIDPGPVPHPLAASTDISKAVRTAYGPDEDYTALAERSIELWRKWNQEFGVRLYHEVGMLFLRRTPMKPGDFEYESLKVAQRRGNRLERIEGKSIRNRFPAWSSEAYIEAVFEKEAGFAESGRVVATLLKRAQAMNVNIRENTRFARLDDDDARVKGIILDDGQRFEADLVIVTVGAWTPYLLPFTRKFFRATGHPVFHFKPSKPELFVPEIFPIFGADISTTGYYGFPLNRDGVVKIANHGLGREISPDSAERVVTREEEEAVREFSEKTFPSLARDPIVYRRVCLYCDTYDGNFWIAPDPDRPGLIIAAGDSGHGFKFAPVLGEIIADAAEQRDNPLLKKFRWRPEITPGLEKEAARFLPGLK